MKSLPALIVPFIATTVFAAEFPEPEGVNVVVSAVSLEPIDPRAVQLSGAPRLDRFAIAPLRSTPASVAVSGRVVANNSRSPLENVAVYINSPLHEPRLAGMTNVDGEFKFRLGIWEGRPAWSVQVKPDWEGDLLLTGADSGHRPTPSPLLSGQALRYRLKTLKEQSERR
jgi:hypothetical protein